ncbi:MAG: zinc ribbon domain-containing protein [Lachnospiraceae bacterium]|nr:zinc ribbon domain-containing protein [Lachnospiraceae bacterium]
MKVCPNCGYKNSDSTTKCVNCGEILVANAGKTAPNTSTYGGNSSAAKTPRYKWSEEVSVFLAAIVVIGFTVASIYLFNKFSGTTLSGVMKSIGEGISSYYDNL